MSPNALNGSASNGWAVTLKKKKEKVRKNNQKLKKKYSGADAHWRNRKLKPLQGGGGMMNCLEFLVNLLELVNDAGPANVNHEEAWKHTAYVVPSRIN